MFEAIMIWLYLALGNFLSIFTPITSVGVICYFAALGIFGLVSEWGQNKSGSYTNEVAVFNFLKSKFKPAVFLLTLVIFMEALYPSKDDLKWIIGGALVWNGAQSVSEIEGIGDLPKNTVDAMNHFLKSLQEEDPAVESKPSETKGE